MESFLLSVLVQSIALRVGNHRAREQPPISFVDNVYSLRKYNGGWSKSGYDSVPLYRVCYIFIHLFNHLFAQHTFIDYLVC